jgi:hypothetical protein
LFLAPVSLLAIASLSIRQQSLIGHILITIVLINVGVSVVEVMLHQQILPEVLEAGDYIKIDPIFRPNGLFDYPLSSGLITVAAMPTVFILVQSFFLKWIVVIVMAASVALAEDRIATIASALILVILAVLSISKDIKSGSVSAPSVFVFFTLSTLIIPAIIFVLYSSGRFERLLMSTSDDKSAAARFVAYDIFNFMTPSEFYWGGMGMNRAMMLARTFLHQIAFESPLVVFVITFGLYFTIIFLPLEYFFVFSISIGSSWYVKLSVITFLIVGSTNNALATGGPALTIVSILAFIAAMRYRFQRERL